MMTSQRRAINFGAVFFLLLLHNYSTSVDLSIVDRAISTQLTAATEALAVKHTTLCATHNNPASVYKNKYNSTANRRTREPRPVEFSYGAFSGSMTQR